VTEVVPILRVRDARASAAFYAKLGFEVEREHEFEPGLPLFVPDTLLYLYIDDADGLYKRLRADGVEVDSTPEEQPWGLREMSLRDPDGNRLRLATVHGRG
jgi:catechol 2,3-dioxygenase-like lactoylglutathione lyase family enzyme